MMQASNIKFDVIGLVEPRKRCPLHVVFRTVQMLFAETCGSRTVCGEREDVAGLARAIAVVYAPTSNY
ncbi:unnamed protein product [Haemonchus placei]|uniref:Piwi domain-containing protein n=1 Tax=Haemonchus placei TaxID=6290 RepID=A0A0N4WUM0_HAEPC|nr:unnamed protein product [Haemonchus placei]